MTNTENWVTSNVLAAITTAATDAKTRRYGASDTSTAARLKGFVEVADGAQQMLRQQVELSHSHGMSWQEIGDALGTSRQAAWEKFHN